MDPELSNNSLKEMAAALHHPGWRCSGLEALRHGARAGWARGAGNSPASATDIAWRWTSTNKERKRGGKGPVAPLPQEAPGWDGAGPCSRRGRAAALGSVRRGSGVFRLLAEELGLVTTR